MVIFGLQEKNPVKFVREREEKELAKEIIEIVQDREQGLEKEVEEVHRIGRYNEGGIRPLTVKPRSQATVEEILARTGKLAENTKYKNIWIKKEILLEGIRHEAEKMGYPGDNRNTAADSGSAGRGRVSALRVMYTNIDGILSSVLKVRDYLKESKPDLLCLD